MENLNETEPEIEVQASEQPVAQATPLAEKPEKSYKGLKIANKIFFVLSVLCAVASAIYLGMFLTTDTIGKAILFVVLFYVPLISVAIGIISLVLSILVVKKAKTSKTTMIANIVFVLLEIVCNLLIFMI